MKNVLIFSNPFGYGPSGKAISIAEYLSDHSSKINIVICGSKHLRSIASGKFDFREIDDRDENSITEVLNSISGRKYVVSSQNRFAIRSAKKCNIPSAFLDGLSWFWREIPEEHFLADIIFWINYPGIKNKIPASQKNKIILVGGITEDVKKSNLIKRNGIEFYLGGCKNPLAPIPRHYLDLSANLLNLAIAKSLVNGISTDRKSQEYLKKYPTVSKKIKISSHTDFIKRIAGPELFITNGGQTAASEAAALNTPISFLLPMNLSQESLINKVLLENKDYPALSWSKYIKPPSNLFSYSEKRALGYYDAASKSILEDKKKLSLLRRDFLQMLSQGKNTELPKILKGLGSTGAKNIFDALEKKWNLT